MSGTKLATNALCLFAAAAWTPPPASPQAPPSIAADGVVAAASYRSGGLAPGMMVSVFGTNLSESTESASGSQLPAEMGAGKTQLLIQGRAAGLYFISPSQINAQIPWETTSPAPLLVISNGRASNTAVIFLAPSFPEVFEFSSQGRRLAAASVSGTLIDSGNPARPGQALSIWCNGLGPLQRPVRSHFAAGEANPLHGVVQVQIGPVTESPLYAGAAPEVPGLNQVNFTLPAGRLLDGRNRLALRTLIAGLPFEPANAVQLSVRNDPSRLTLLNASYEGTYELGDGSRGRAVLSDVVLLEGAAAATLTLVDEKTGAASRSELRGRLLAGDRIAEFNILVPGRQPAVLTLEVSSESLEAAGTLRDDTQGRNGKVSLRRTF